MEGLVLFFWTVGLINAATYAPLPQYYAVAPPPPVYRAETPSAPRRDSAAAKAFGEHWQNFMEPSVSRSAAPSAGFGSGPRG